MTSRHVSSELFATKQVLRLAKTCATEEQDQDKFHSGKLHFGWSILYCYYSPLRLGRSNEKHAYALTLYRRPTIVTVAANLSLGERRTPSSIIIKRPVKPTRSSPIRRGIVFATSSRACCSTKVQNSAEQDPWLFSRLFCTRQIFPLITSPRAKSMRVEHRRMAPVAFWRRQEHAIINACHQTNTSHRLQSHMDQIDGFSDVVGSCTRTPTTQVTC